VSDNSRPATAMALNAIRTPPIQAAAWTNWAVDFGGDAVTGGARS